MTNLLSSALFFCCFFVQTLNAQQEKICTSFPTPKNCSTSFTFTSAPATGASSNKVTFKVEENRAGGSTLATTGWYKAFWVYGDGNFKDYPFLASNDKPGATATRTSTYKYGLPGEYEAKVFLTETYSNDVPPTMPKIVVKTTATLPTAKQPVERTTLAPNELVSIVPSHKPRIKYPTLLAVSWNKQVNASRLIVFYNGRLNGTAISANPTLNTYDNVSFPNYFLPTVESNAVNDLTANNPDFAALSSEFGNYISYDLTSAAGTINIPSYFSEMRLFPIFKTNDFTGDPVLMASKMSFMAVVMSTDPDPKFAAISKDYQDQFNKEFDGAITSNEQLVGYKVYSENVVTSHDPNLLTVENIEDQGGGAFKVTFKLAISNTGDIPEHNVTVRVTDQSNPQLFHDLRYTNPHIPSSLNQTGQTWTANGFVPQLTIPVVPQPYSPIFKEVFFTMKTNAEGIESLKEVDDDLRPIQACVDFSASTDGPECTLNTPVTEESSNLNGTQCDHNYLWMIIGCLLALCLFIIFACFVRGKKKHGQHH